MPLGERPVDPARLVVLAVRVVVAPLGAAELVPAEEHRHASGDGEGQQEVLDLPPAHRLDGRVVGFAFDAVVRAEVLVGAVPIVLAVGLVVFPRVADQIVQREAVVAGDEVDAALRALARIPRTDRSCRRCGWRSGPSCPRPLARTAARRRGNGRSTPPSGGGRSCRPDRRRRHPRPRR